MRDIMGWDEQVLAVIRNNWEVGQEFTLLDIYRFESVISAHHPGNRHVREKIRQQLQVLPGLEPERLTLRLCL